MTSHHPTTARSSNNLVRVVVFVMILMVGVLGYGFFRIMTLDKQVVALSAQLASTNEKLYGTAGQLSQLSSTTEGLSQTLTSTTEVVTNVSNNVNSVQQQVGGVQQQVGHLQKLSTIDPELLKKYSKVYFLNENYTPAHLSLIPQDYVYSNTKQEMFAQEALPFLLRMLNDAKAAGVTLHVNSGYRSFGKQGTLKSQYKVTYGAGTASTFAADQGYSEHQLGATVDLVTSGSNGDLVQAFEKTPAFTWLKENAHKYGFEMSYPKGNAYYVYEPWHWRFVGVKLATYLHESKSNFYDLDQRDIDAYLVTLFDN